MNTTDHFRPRRQTMLNVKPTDYVPFEHMVRAIAIQQANTDKPVGQPSK